MFGHDDQKDEDITTINPTLGTDDTTVAPTEDPSIATDSTAAPVEDTTVTPTVDPAPADDTPETITDSVTESTEETPAETGAPIVVTSDTTEETVDEAGAPEVTTTETKTETTTPEDTTPDVTEEVAEEITATPAFSDGATTDSSATTEDHDGLLDLKKEALGELAPLIDQLDQSPEEKFKTTMMMIQATDDSNLVKIAHDAAQKITDEKIRAQALLDIVNEINYFTQKDTK